MNGYAARSVGAPMSSSVLSLVAGEGVTPFT